MIKTKRLTIYPASDDEMRDIISTEPVPELKAAYGEMLAGCAAHPDAREWYAIWNVELAGEGTVVGNLSFKGLGADGAVEIGYGTNAGYECRGYMTEAVSAVARWAAAQNGVTRIEAETEDGNAASKRVLEKSGFIPTGEAGKEGPRYVWHGK